MITSHNFLLLHKNVIEMFSWFSANMKFLVVARPDILSGLSQLNVFGLWYTNSLWPFLEHERTKLISSRKQSVFVGLFTCNLWFLKFKSHDSETIKSSFETICCFSCSRSIRTHLLFWCLAILFWKFGVNQVSLKSHYVRPNLDISLQCLL